MKNNSIKNNTQEKTIGILGGMGPYATVMFMKNIMDLTHARKDWDHLRLVVDNNPHIPSRTRSVLYKEQSPVKGMIESCLKLQKYPVDVILIPCNSAAYWIKQVQKNLFVPIVNIIEVAVSALIKDKKKLRVIVLGGMVTFLKDTYKDSVKKFGSIYVRPDENTQKRVVSLIEAIKLGASRADLEKRYLSLTSELIKKKRVGGIILACTELTIFKDVRLDVPVVDSSWELAKFIVDYAKNKDAGLIKT